MEAECPNLKTNAPKAHPKRFRCRAREREGRFPNMPPLMEGSLIPTGLSGRNAGWEVMRCTSTPLRPTRGEPRKTRLGPLRPSHRPRRPAQSQATLQTDTPRRNPLGYPGVSRGGNGRPRRRKSEGVGEIIGHRWRPGGPGAAGSGRAAGWGAMGVGSRMEKKSRGDWAGCARYRRQPGRRLAMGREGPWGAELD